AGPTVTVTSVPNHPPAASVTVDVTSGPEPLTVHYDGSASSDADGVIQSYHWNFGDGSTGTGPAPFHTYPRPGQYTATLTVTDNAGASTSAAAPTVKVGSPGIPPMFTADSPPATATVGSPYSYTFVSTGSPTPTF